MARVYRHLFPYIGHPALHVCIWRSSRIAKSNYNFWFYNFDNLLMYGPAYVGQLKKFNIRGLPDMVPLAAELGVDEIMVTNIDYLAGERCNFLRTFYHESPSKAFQESLDEMHRRGKETGIAVRTYPLKVEEVLVCEANPPQNVFFSVDGSVAPCVYLRIPKKGDIPRIFQNEHYVVPQTVFGNIIDEDLFEIWNKEPYKKFRQVYEDRIQGKFGIGEALEALESMNFSSLKERSDKEMPPLPEVCQTCYKAYGI